MGFLKCSIKSFTIDLHRHCLVTKFNSMKSRSTTTYLSQSAADTNLKVALLSLQHVSVSQVFSTPAERFNFQTIVEVWASFCLSSSVTGSLLELLGWKVILGLKKRWFETFCLKQQKDPPWTHFKLTTPLHTAQVNISPKYTSFAILPSLISKLNVCHHVKQPWILWSRIYLDKDLCVSSYLPRF